MSNTIPVTFRVDRELKEHATSIFSGLGLDLTTAIKIYLSKVVINNGIPFTLDYSPSIPNEETMSALRWTENYISEGKKVGFNTPQDLFNYLEI